MSSSEEENRVYQPVLAEQIRGAARSPQLHASPVQWPQTRDGGQVYNNDLFADGTGDSDLPGNAAFPVRNSQCIAFGDVPLSSGHHSSLNNNITNANGGHNIHNNNSNNNNNSRGGTPGQTSLMARRAARLQAAGVERNDPLSGSQRLTTNLHPNHAGEASQQLGPLKADDDPHSYASNRADVTAAICTLPSTFDPNEDDEDEECQYGAGPNNTAANNAAHQYPFAYPAAATSPANHLSRFGHPQHAPQLPPPLEVDVNDLPSVLNMPGPKHGPVQCYIVRDKSGSGSKLHPRYTLFLEHGGRFLLAARKRKKSKTSNYVMSLDNGDLARESDNFFGKLRSNFVGTEFTVYDNGGKNAAGGQVDRDADGAGSVRSELGAVTYGYNVLGTRGPRRMTGVIPALDAQGRSLYQPQSEDDTLVDRVKNHRALSDLMVMHNKPPRWNDELNAFCLNFNGRVTEASVKNFQLITDDNQNHVILQFGKVGKHVFTMDYQWPISALQAFGICLTSFDNKLACE